MEILQHTSNHINKVTPEELTDLFKRCSEGDQAARDRIILSFLPLVSSICREYEGRGVPTDDLFQEGCYGLLIALGKFDYTGSRTFSEFAAPYIKKHLQRAQITQGVYQPIVYKEDFFYELQRYLNTLDVQTEQLQREPTDKELAKALKTTIMKIRKYRQSLYVFFPLEDLIGPGRDSNSSYHPSAEDRTMSQVLDLSCLGIELTEIENNVLRRRFGFTESGVPETFTEIEKSLGLTNSQVRYAYYHSMERIKAGVEANGYTINSIPI